VAVESSGVSRLMSMNRRKRAAVAALREFQSTLSKLPEAGPTTPAEESDRPLWYTRAGLQERIFQRIAELNIPLDKDKENG
jgi:hypothetical protein